MGPIERSTKISFLFGVTGLAYSLKLGSNKDVGLKYLTIKFEYLEEKIRCIPIFARIGRKSAQKLFEPVGRDRFGS